MSWKVAAMAPTAKENRKRNAMYSVMADDRRERGVNAALLELGADHRPDDFGADHLEAGQPGFLQHLHDLLRALLETGALFRGLNLGQPDQPLSLARLSVLLNDLLTWQAVHRLPNLIRS